MKYTVIIILSILLCVPAFAEGKAAKVEISKLPTLMDFGASKCVACKKMTVILDELAKSHSNDFKVVFVDVWKNENLPQAEQFKISKIPTQVFQSAEGKELWRHIGFISKKDILAKWKELGFSFAEQEVKVKKDKSISDSGMKRDTGENPSN